MPRAPQCRIPRITEGLYSENSERVQDFGASTCFSRRGSLCRCSVVGASERWRGPLRECDAGMGRFIRLGPLTAPLDAVIDMPVRAKEPDSCCGMNARYSLLRKNRTGVATAPSLARLLTP